MLVNIWAPLGKFGYKMFILVSGITDEKQEPHYYYANLANLFAKY